jgi:hypothetical protein
MAWYRVSFTFLLTEYGGRNVSALVTKLLNKILARANFPQEMETGHLIPMHKEIKGCVRIRGINITNPFIKILGNLLKNWTAEIYKRNDKPSGFTKGGSTVDHIYIRQILEKYNTQQEDISFIFYNLEKVYDSVPKKLLWQALANQLHKLLK